MTFDLQCHVSSVDHGHKWWHLFSLSHFGTDDDRNSFKVSMKFPISKLYHSLLSIYARAN